MAFTFDPNQAPDLVSGDSPVYERTGATVPPVVGVTTPENTITGFLSKERTLPRGYSDGDRYNFSSSDGGNITATVCHDVFAPMPGASGNAEVVDVARLRSDAFTYEVMSGEDSGADNEIVRLEITINEDIDADMLIARAQFTIGATSTSYQQWVTFGKTRVGALPPGSPVTYRSTPMNLNASGISAGTLTLQFI